MGRKIKTREDFIDPYLTIYFQVKNDTRCILFVEGITDKKACLKIFPHFEPSLELKKDSDIECESFQKAYNKMNDSYKNKQKLKKGQPIDIQIDKDVEDTLNANCKFVIKCIEYFNKTTRIFSYDAYGFIDYDYGEHENDIKDLQFIKQTTEHDLEMNLIHSCMPKFIAEIRNKDSEWANLAITDFIFCLRYCICLNFLQKSCFDYINNKKISEEEKNNLFKEYVSNFNCNYLNIDIKNYANNVLSQIENKSRKHHLVTDLNEEEIESWFESQIENDELYESFNNLEDKYESILTNIDIVVKKWLSKGNDSLSEEEKVQLNQLLRFPVGHGFIKCLLLKAIKKCDDDINHYYNLDGIKFIREDDFREKLLEFACKDTNELAKLEPYNSYRKFRETVK